MIKLTPCLLIIILLNFNAIYSKVIDVRDFGAIGDGRINNTLYFEKAILSLNNKDTLHIPKGEFIIDYLKLKNKPNITITGDGVLRASDKSSQYFVVINNCDFLNIESISLNGNHNARVGIELWNSKNVVLQNLNVFNFKAKEDYWSAGILVRDGNEGIRILNTKINNITSIYNAAVGIYVFINIPKSYENSKILIKQNFIEDIDSPLDADAIKLQNLNYKSNVVIEDNVIRNFRKRAIKIQTNNVEVIGNKIYQNENFGNALAVVSVYGSDIVIKENYFESYGNSSVNMFADISSVENVVLSNNSFIISKKSKAYVKDFINIKHHNYDDINYSSNILVQENYISNARHFLFLNSNIYNSLFENNDLIDVKSSVIGTSPTIAFTDINIIMRKNSWNKTKQEVFVTSNKNIKNVLIKDN